MPRADAQLRCLPLAAAILLAAGCATRSADVAPRAVDAATAAAFEGWDCDRLDAEADRVAKRAADVAYAVDEQAGRNIMALGVGVAVFWPALIAMRPPGPEADELARLKGRHEALQQAGGRRGCVAFGVKLPSARALALPAAAGERLVYTQREGVRGPAVEAGLRIVAFRRDEVEYRVEPADARIDARFKHDLAGNVLVAPPGALRWPNLLRHELGLGQVLGGEMAIEGDLTARARLRGQVVALGDQVVAGRRFQAVIVELFGDAQTGDSSGRIDGVIVVDAASGILLRLDLISAQAGFTLQRRLVRIEPGP
jgi:hypothetical protein